MTKYELILYWSVDDDAFIAEVPELPGCAADAPLDSRHWRMPRPRFRNGSKPLRNWGGLYLSQKDGSYSPDALESSQPTSF
jgi:hypothetical protein